MVQENKTLRHEKFLPKERRQIGINLIGAGSVGSHIALMLMRVGFPNLQVYDPDIVEDQNLGNQAYPDSAVGRPKVEALKEEAERLGIRGLMVADCNYPSIDTPPIPGIVVSAVDTMDSRRAIWEDIKDNPAVELYVDTRMGLIQGNVYWVRPRDRTMRKWYETQLVGDGVEDPCDAHTIMHTVLLIAGMAGSHIIRFALEDKEPDPLTIVDARNLKISHVKIA